MVLRVVGSLLASLLRFVFGGLAYVVLVGVMVAIDVAVQTFLAAQSLGYWLRRHPLYVRAIGMSIVGTIFMAAASRVLLSFEPLDSGGTWIVVASLVGFVASTSVAVRCKLKGGKQY